MIGTAFQKCSLGLALTITHKRDAVLSPILQMQMLKVREVEQDLAAKKENLK